MPLYQQDASGRFVPFEPIMMPGYEKDPESWIEAWLNITFGQESGGLVNHVRLNATLPAVR